jgi:hypothetical protein
VKDAVIGAVVIVVGGAMFLFRDSFGRFALGQQNRVWGFRFGSRALIATRMVSAVVGFGFVLVGALALLGMIHFR